MSVGRDLRVAIGGNADWVDDALKLGRKPSGYAPMSFKESDDNIAWVFSDTLFDRRDISNRDLGLMIATTVSHEAGHTFGLRHKGDFDAEGTRIKNSAGDPILYSGGDATWTPIMGANLSSDRTIWTDKSVEVVDGSDSVFVEGDDDIVVLTDQLGSRADDFADFESLGHLSRFSNDAIATGIIETQSDVDSFTFTVGESGPLSIQLLVNDVAANLDSKIRLFGNGVLVEESNLPNDLNATIQDWAVVPGEYRVEVGSAQQFSGDVGQYTLRINFGNSLPTLSGITLIDSTSSLLTDRLKSTTSLVGLTAAIAGDGGSRDTKSSKIVGGEDEQLAEVKAVDDSKLAGTSTTLDVSSVDALLAEAPSSHSHELHDLALAQLDVAKLGRLAR
jgi:hypothetical protein